MRTNHSTSVQVEELTLDVRLKHDGPVFDTVTASDFAIWVNFTYLPGFPPILTGPMEDADPGAPDTVHINRITAVGKIEFMGNYSVATDPKDLSEYVALTIPMEHDIKNMFDQKQYQRIEDELLARYLNGDFNDE